MGGRKRYTASSIPRRKARRDKAPLAREGRSGAVLYSDGVFAEIEYEHKTGITAGGEGGRRAYPLVPASSLIGERVADPIRKRFHDMRRLASDNPFSRDDAGLFYRQAKFMEDFTDDYDGNHPFSMYYPYYQHMSYEQLRTFFTWRTKVRWGEILPVPASYVFLYIYELLSGIGVEDPADGLCKLMTIWDLFREREPVLDKYFPRWLKDYHIYYELPHSFADFVSVHSLLRYYNVMFLFGADKENCLALWNGISAYDVTQSKFYNDGNEELLRDCFYAVFHALRAFCARHNARIEDLIVYGVGNGIPWHPFGQALFGNWYSRPDRRVGMPGGDTYVCVDNRWTASIAVYHSNKKDIAGYLIKKTEECLRRAVKYKSKITASPHFIKSLSPRQKEFGIPFAQLDEAIEKAVADFIRGRNRTVVAVDHSNLARIRDEALGTQNKLTVPEENMPPIAVTAPPVLQAAEWHIDKQQNNTAGTSHNEWTLLKGILSAIEHEALSIALSRTRDIKAFADENSIMLEVLADGINEKAMDCVGDNILELDGGIVIYGEYIDKVSEMVNGHGE